LIKINCVGWNSKTIYKFEFLFLILMIVGMWNEKKRGVKHLKCYIYFLLSVLAIWNYRCRL